MMHTKRAQNNSETYTYIWLTCSACDNQCLSTMAEPGRFEQQPQSELEAQEALCQRMAWPGWRLDEYGALAVHKHCGKPQIRQFMSLKSD